MDVRCVSKDLFAPLDIASEGPLENEEPLFDSQATLGTDGRTDGRTRFKHKEGKKGRS